MQRDLDGAATLDAAIDTCQRFVKRAKTYRNLPANSDEKWSGGRIRAAADRASLDATRALAVWRRRWRHPYIQEDSYFEPECYLTHARSDET